MKLELALLGDHPAAKTLEGDVREMEAMIEAYLAFARGQDAEPPVPSDLTAILADVVEDARRQGRDVALNTREPLLLPSRPNEVWSMDFVMDALSSGRRLKCLTVVDDFTKEAIELMIDHSITGDYVTRALDQVVRFRGAPRAIRTDQGPEFTGQALDQWAYRHGVDLKLIQAGKPTQNAYIESFNGKFRDECLNEHWFATLAEARVLVNEWRRDYNERRPHSALQYQTPAEFAARARNASLCERVKTMENST